MLEEKQLGQLWKAFYLTIGRLALRLVCHRVAEGVLAPVGHNGPLCVVCERGKEGAKGKAGGALGAQQQPTHAANLRAVRAGRGAG